MRDIGIASRPTRGVSTSGVTALPITALLITALLAALGCLPAPGDGTSGSASPSGVDGPRPLVVIGIDGATWDVIDPMIERGELPHLRRLVERGARIRLISLPPLVSPVAWTTYATGTFSRKHWILDFTYPYVPGEKHPIESTQRREPAIWNAASRHGRKVGVVGYYVTNPADVVDGFMVSDSLLAARSGSTYPLDLKPEVEALGQWPRQEVFGRFLTWGYQPTQADDPESPYHHVSRIIRGRVDGAIVRDENVRRTALALLDREFDLFLTYFRLVDHASHSTWLYYDDADFGTAADPADKELLQDLIPESYRYTDEFVGEVMGRLGEAVNLVVVSDHGHGSATGPYAIHDPSLVDKLTGNHRFDGVLLAAGPDIRTGEFTGINSMDVAPLLFALSGVPLSRELPGRLPEELLTAGFVEQFVGPAVAAYDQEWQTVESPPADPGADDETLRELKALGYIQSDTKTGGRGPERAVDFWSIQPQLRENALLGELLFYLLTDDLDRARRLMAAVERRDPALAGRLPALVRSYSTNMQNDFEEDLFSETVLESFYAAHGG